MTVVRLNRRIKETPTPARRKKRASDTKTRRSFQKELVFGLIIGAIILSLATISAFNGGVSLEAGKLQMTLDASFTDGLHLSFVSI